MDLQRLKSLPQWKRRQLRLGRRGAYKSHLRLASQQDVISRLRTHNVRSANQLRRLCKERSDVPTIYSAMRTLNTSWKGVLEHVWGKEPPGLGAASRKPTHETLLNTALHYGLTTRAAWDKARASDRRVFPSRYWLLKHYGSVPNFFSIVDDHAAAVHFKKYRALLEAQGGRPPTEEQCRLAGINMTALNKLMPKRTLDNVLSVISPRR